MHKEDEGLTAYFFTNFPREYGETNMWGVFQRWGVIKDLFIAKRRTKHGMRYGFVGFADVWDPKELERELDKIYIGNMKLYVNLPRFGRHERQRKTYKYVHHGDNNPMAPHKVLGRLDMHAFRRPGISFADATIKGTVKHVMRHRQVEPNVNQGWRGVDIKVEETNKLWLEKCMIGRVTDPWNFMEIQDAFLTEGYSIIKVRYLGDNLVLLSGEEDDNLHDILEGEEEWLRKWFESVTPWSSSITSGNRVVWVRCHGLPLHLWNDDCLSKVVATEGTFLKTHEETVSMINLEYAKVLIRTSSLNSIDFTRDVRINDIILSLRLVEEQAHAHALSHSCCQAQSDTNSERLSKICSGDELLSFMGSDDEKGLGEYAEDEHAIDEDLNHRGEQPSIRTGNEIVATLPHASQIQGGQEINALPGERRSLIGHDPNVCIGSDPICETSNVLHHLGSVHAMALCQEDAQVKGICAEDVLHADTNEKKKGTCSAELSDSKANRNTNLITTSNKMRKRNQAEKVHTKPKKVRSKPNLKLKGPIRRCKLFDLRYLPIKQNRIKPKQLGPVQISFTSSTGIVVHETQPVPRGEDLLSILVTDPAPLAYPIIDQKLHHDMAGTEEDANQVDQVCPPMAKYNLSRSYKRKSKSIMRVEPSTTTTAKQKLVSHIGREGTTAKNNFEGSTISQLEKGKKLSHLSRKRTTAKFAPCRSYLNGVKWLADDRVEAERMWLILGELGVQIRMTKEQFIDRMLAMEKRDKAEIGKGSAHSSRRAANSVP